MTPPELAVVFPRAGRTGGVERVALELMRVQSRRRSTRFVGLSIDDPAMSHTAVRMPHVPSAFRPPAFRRAAARVLRDLAPTTTISLGVECPPGDVYWVGSVHAAWLAEGGEMYVRGHRVPPGARRLLARHQVLLRLERSYFRSANPRAILCTSQREIDDLAGFYGVARERMHLAPNGYDGAVFDPDRRAALRARAREEIGATTDDIVVLFVANELHRKGLGVLLRAVARAGDRRLRVDVIGRKPPTDYEPLARSLGVRLRWHGPTPDVSRYYAAAETVALPSTYEPFGLVVIEAMAMGLPVVTTRLAGAAAAITDGVSGLLLDDPTDVAALAERVAHLTEPAERDRIGGAAVDAAAPYEWTAVLARVEEVIFPGSA